MVHCPICGPREALEPLLKKAEKERYLAWKEARPILQELEEEWKKNRNSKSFDNLLVPGPRPDRRKELAERQRVLARTETAVAVLVRCNTRSWDDVHLEGEELRLAHERQLTVFQDPELRRELGIPETEEAFEMALRKREKLPSTIFQDIFQDVLRPDQLESYWCVMVVELVSIKGLLKDSRYNKADLGYVKGKGERGEDKTLTARRELQEEVFLPPDQFESKQSELDRDWVVFVHRSPEADQRKSGARAALALAPAAAEPAEPTEPVRGGGNAQRGVGGARGQRGSRRSGRARGSAGMSGPGAEAGSARASSQVGASGPARGHGAGGEDVPRGERGGRGGRGLGGARGGGPRGGPKIKPAQSLAKAS